MNASLLYVYLWVQTHREPFIDSFVASSCSRPSACSSLCSAGSGGAPAGRGPHSSSLMHCVMKLASGVAADNSPVQKLAFSLLANLAMSRDCRGVLQKVIPLVVVHVDGDVATRAQHVWKNDPDEDTTYNVQTAQRVRLEAQRPPRRR